MDTKSNTTNKTPDHAGNSAGQLKITGNWETQAKQLKEKFPQLTDADLKFVTGKENELVSRIGLRLHKKDDEVIHILKKGQSSKV
jgi:hypothetical protein